MNQGDKGSASSAIKKLFPGNWKKDADKNEVGYGADNKFVPPIKEPKTVLGLIDKWFVTMASGGPF